MHASIRFNISSLLTTCPNYPFQSFFPIFCFTNLHTISSLFLSLQPSILPNSLSLHLLCSSIFYLSFRFGFLFSITFSRLLVATSSPNLLTLECRLCHFYFVSHLFLSLFKLIFILLLSFVGDLDCLLILVYNVGFSVRCWLYGVRKL